MALFRIHAIDRSGTLTQSTFNELEKLFVEVCSYPQAKPFDNACVYWWTDRPVHNSPHEPLVWFLPSKAKSLIKKVFNINPSQNDGGLTKVSSSRGNISEVYLDHPISKTARGRAFLAFHELMHNKLQQGDEMHDPSLGLGRGAIDMSSPFSASLNSEDCKLVAPELNTPVPQWMPPFR